jgi:hypothetical protein
MAACMCSVHRQENEDVVESILARAPRGFKLVKALPTWPHRGLPDAPPNIGPLVVRATHVKDSTNGFFVARFERHASPTPSRGEVQKKENNKGTKRSRDTLVEDESEEEQAAAEEEEEEEDLKARKVKSRKAGGAQESTDTCLDASESKQLPKHSTKLGAGKKGEKKHKSKAAESKAAETTKARPFLEYRPTAPGTRPWAGRAARVMSPMCMRHVVYEGR